MENLKGLLGAGWLAASLLTMGGNAMAQETVIARPGDGTVDGSFLRPYEAEFRLERKAPDGSVGPFGRWTDTVRFVDHEGQRLLERRVARFTSEDVKDLWRQHLVDPGSLAPVLTLQHMGTDLEQSMELVFRGDSLHARVVGLAGPGEQTLSAALPEPVYDLALYATLLVAFPLEEGFTARFPIYGQQLNVEWETMRVTGSERIEVEDGRTVEAWKVSTETRPWTAWLTKEAPYIASIVQRMPDGSEVTSIRTRWEPVEDTSLSGGARQLSR